MTIATLGEAPASPARRTQADRTSAMRARLLEATFDCLADVGYAGTTTTEVVRRAGVSRGAQVHHFPTKTDLVVAALEHVLRRRHDEFRAAFEGIPSEERTQARAIGLLWDMYRGPTFTAWLELAVAARTDPELHRRFMEVQTADDELIVSTFADLYPDAPDPHFSRAAVSMAFAVLDGLGLQRAVGVTTGADPEDVVVLLQGLAEMFAPQLGGTT